MRRTSTVPRARRRGLALRAARLAAVVAGVWLALCVATLVALRSAPPLVTALQIQRWIEYGERPHVRTAVVPLRTLGPNLPRAVIAAEDARFYQHHGIDWDGVRSAVDDNLHRRAHWRGGSTITQQLVKNLFFGTRGSFVRKLLEAPLALLAEVILPKQRILELYLNVVEWGPGLYGAEAAAARYYDTQAVYLTREQAARLAACLPAPRTRRPQHMNAYAAKILGRMGDTRVGADGLRQKPE
jgi:monofunctional biosynthetic peptidoglycan transglycosylase